MRILWLTNNACSAMELLDPQNTRGGWLVSLEKELSQLDEIELHIGFYHKKSLTPFQHGQTTFHPIGPKREKGRILRYLDKLFTNSINDQKEIEKLLNLVKDVQPQLIHIHGTEGNFGLIQGQSSTPIVISIQGLLNPLVEKFYGGIPKDDAKRYESYKDKLTLRSASNIYRLLNTKAKREKKILSKARFIIGRTRWDRAVTRLLAPQSTYFIGQELLRPSFYTKTWHNTKWNASLKIVSVTSDSLPKGFASIVKAAMLLKRYPGFDFVWSIAGLDRRSHCVRLVKKWLGVDLQEIGLRFLGNQTENQLTDLLASSDVFCQVSHIENSSNSLCEAMMIGMPCIATFSGGTSSILSDGKEGLLVQDGDAFSLSGAIIELYKDFEKAKKYGDEARRAALSRHDKSRVINDLFDIYNTILN
jgi:glycosyltransferase involved in cell wall biosynthesis